MTHQRTSRIVLLGHPIGHSRSPGMQQAALDALGIPAQYELWDTPPETLVERIAALREPEMLGANVTIPHKTAVLPLLDTVVSDALRLVGAVNTITREHVHGGVQLVGHNTDLAGLQRALDDHSAFAGAQRMLVLGAGGAAQAALGLAMRRNIEVWVAARRRDAARAALLALWQRQHTDERSNTSSASAVPGNAREALATLPSNWDERALELPSDAPTTPANADRRNGYEALRAILARTDILINATPVGTNDLRASPLPLECVRDLPQHAFVFDMVYNPAATALVQATQASGRRASGGLPMLLYQGAAAFTLWTHREAPLHAMRAALGLR